ncbi:MAG: hypothetical protein ACPGD5_08655, partial [Salibacteraceae bacterium]
AQTVSNFFIFEVSKEPIFLLCDKFEILKVSSKAELEIFGEQGVPDNFNFADIVTDQDKKRVNRTLLNLLDNGVSNKIQFRIKSLNNVEWVEFDWQYIEKDGGKFILGLGSHIYAPDKKDLIAFETSEALKDAEILGKMGSWWVNPKTMENHWSEGNYRIWNVNPNQPIPPVNWVIKHLPKEDAELITKAIKNVGETGEIAELTFKMRLNQKDDYRYFFTRIRPWIVNGEIVEVKGVNFEVTDLVKHQLELEKRNVDLNRKNEKLLKYVQMNSHDVRGPLSNILSLLEMEKQEPMEHQNFVKYVSDSAEKLDETLRRINENLLIED